MKPIPFIIVFKCLCERNEIKKDYYLYKKIILSKYFIIKCTDTGEILNWFYKNKFFSADLNIFSTMSCLFVLLLLLQFSRNNTGRV